MHPNSGSQATQGNRFVCMLFNESIGFCQPRGLRCRRVISSMRKLGEGKNCPSFESHSANVIQPPKFMANFEGALTQKSIRRDWTPRADSKPAFGIDRNQQGKHF
jgi:hypothetical protein